MVLSPVPGPLSELQTWKHELQTWKHELQTRVWGGAGRVSTSLPRCSLFCTGCLHWEPVILITGGVCWSKLWMMEAEIAENPIHQTHLLHGLCLACHTVWEPHFACRSFTDSPQCLQRSCAIHPWARAIIPHPLGGHHDWWPIIYENSTLQACLQIPIRNFN